ncbi:MAG: pyridoxamine 5'-phosphate oxidase family protein [Planctomycetota bacterium]
MESCIRELLTSNRLGVLSTCAKDRPHASLVALLTTNDLKFILFATLRSTKKYENLISNSHVAMLIDNRSNEDYDFHEAAAVTVTGRARELHVNERAEWSDLFLSKHPHLKDFVESPNCALFIVEVERYRLVRKFQQVMEYVPE